MCLYDRQICKTSKSPPRAARADLLLGRVGGVEVWDGAELDDAHDPMRRLVDMGNLIAGAMNTLGLSRKGAATGGVEGKGKRSGGDTAAVCRMCRADSQGQRHAICGRHGIDAGRTLRAAGDDAGKPAGVGHRRGSNVVWQQWMRRSRTCRESCREQKQVCGGLASHGHGLEPAASVITHLLASHRQVSTLRMGSGMRSGSSIPVNAKCRPQLNSSTRTAASVRMWAAEW